MSGTIIQITMSVPDNGEALVKALERLVSPLTIVRSEQAPKAEAKQSKTSEGTGEKPPVDEQALLSDLNVVFAKHNAARWQAAVAAACAINAIQDGKYQLFSFQCRPVISYEGFERK